MSSRQKKRQRLLIFIGCPCLLCVFIWFMIVNHINTNVSDSHKNSENTGVTTFFNKREKHSRNLDSEVKRIIQSKGPDQKIFSNQLKSILNNSTGCARCSDVSTCFPCRKENQKLLGDLRKHTKNSNTLLDIEKANPSVHRGGSWSPISCSTSESVAILIPFRNRWTQLKILLSVLHPMLQRQQRCYRIFITEQYGCQAFNKGRLNNVAFLEAAKLFNFKCVIFQDTDIIPEDDRNPYDCPTTRPRHMAVAVDVHKYKLPYSALVGGVIAFTVDHYLAVNGYSNLYWGWGLEDDDMELRMKIGSHLRYTRPKATFARYRAVPHSPQHIFNIQGARRKPLLSTVTKRFLKDGLNTIKYTIMFIHMEPLFTHILVDVGTQPSDFEDG